MKVVNILVILSVICLNGIQAQDAKADGSLNSCVAGSMTDRQVCSDAAYEICRKNKMVPICCPNSGAAPECYCCHGWSRPDTSTTTCPCDGRKANPSWCKSPSSFREALI
ncbi:unnamed protein product [Orchesella dallaii]|uniref:Uncharacterized protein n=1 Tax=Orchesella dallaii TaxID=48710 RepID=A0ABP1RMS4_9HEXA